MNGAPLGYLTSAGARAATIVPLTWFLTILSIAVCLVIGALLWFGVRRARGERAPVERRGLQHERNGAAHHLSACVAAMPACGGASAIDSPECATR